MQLTPFGQRSSKKSYSSFILRRKSLPLPYLWFYRSRAFGFDCWHTVKTYSPGAAIVTRVRAYSLLSFAHEYFDWSLYLQIYRFSNECIKSSQFIQKLPSSVSGILYCSLFFFPHLFSSRLLHSPVQDLQPSGLRNLTRLQPVPSLSQRISTAVTAQLWFS